MHDGHRLGRLAIVLLSVVAGVTMHHHAAAQSNVAPSRIEVRGVGHAGVRITLLPADYPEALPFSPALADPSWSEPALSITRATQHAALDVGNLHVAVARDPLTVRISRLDSTTLQRVVFRPDGSVSFDMDQAPILGLGEGGPLPAQGEVWRDDPVEFDRRGRLHHMQPRWQSDMYGSRNPVPLLIGTAGWALFVSAPWGEIDLRHRDEGRFVPRPPADPDSMRQNRDNQQLSLGKGKPPADSVVEGVFDVFVFDASDPTVFMKDVSDLTGPAVVLPPEWALGYMQSHRTLEDDARLVGIVDTFREKEIPVDAVIYLGTGFTPRGWNTEQPSFTFNPEVFKRDPQEVLADLHDRHVKVVVHMVPWDRDRLPVLHGSIPPRAGEHLDPGHIAAYWQEHVPLFKTGVDAFWPDEGDWFDLFERMTRHRMYHEGPLSTRPNTRPWSLHRNGYLGVARWGGWIWSGDTDSAWKSLEAQVAVGINSSLSLSPFWGSDIGGFYSNEELTGELYARWFQFGAFCPSFRAHGRTWWRRLPWGWGLSEMGPLETRTPPLESELNNPAIEPVVKRYDELRYRLLPYNYTLAWQTRETGLPMMRALWLHYPDDPTARRAGSVYLWGRDLLIAPVFKPGAAAWPVYLPDGDWYDWWTGERLTGGREVVRPVDLATMPIYVRAGAIIPLDPVRQYTSEPVQEPTTIRVFPGADGLFELYEDDGQSLDYLRGEFTVTGFSWDDAARTLVIEPVHSGYGDTREERSFRVEVANENVVRTVYYSGARTRVSF